MMVISSKQMFRMDREATLRYGIPSLLLMESAGIACARQALEMLRGKKGRVLVFCGKGNNGGDGFSAARHLANAKKEPIVFYFQRPAQMKPDAFTYFEILRKIKVPLVNCSSGFKPQCVRRHSKKPSLILDAIFGIGLARAVEEPFRAAIRWINQSGAAVLALDVPSGLSADTGRVWGSSCVRATRTVTFGLAKRGLIKPCARLFTGRIVVDPISYPGKLLKKYSLSGSP